MILFRLPFVLVAAILLTLSAAAARAQGDLDALAQVEALEVIEAALLTTLDDLLYHDADIDDPIWVGRTFADTGIHPGAEVRSELERFAARAQEFDLDLDMLGLMTPVERLVFETLRFADEAAARDQLARQAVDRAMAELRQLSAANRAAVLADIDREMAFVQAQIREWQALADAAPDTPAGAGTRVTDTGGGAPQPIGDTTGWRNVIPQPGGASGDHGISGGDPDAHGFSNDMTGVEGLPFQIEGREFFGW